MAHAEMTIDGLGPMPWPDRLPIQYNGGIRCDMFLGPCACGSWHIGHDFYYVADEKGDKLINAMFDTPEQATWAMKDLGTGIVVHVKTSITIKKK